MKVHLNKNVFCDNTSQQDFDSLVNVITYKNRYDLYLDSDSFEKSGLYVNTADYNKEIMKEAFVNSINMTIDKDVDCEISTKTITDTKRIYTVEEGITYLTMPLTIVLENELNDGHFVEAIISKFLPNDKKIDVGQYKSNNWLVFDGAGGKVNIPSKVESRYQSCGYKKKMLKLYVIFDSDKKFLGDSDKNVSLKEKLDELSIPHHELEKRSIENYIPEELFREEPFYCKANSEWIDAYSYLSEQQKDYISIAGGYSVDVKKEADNKSVPFKNRYFNRDQFDFIKDISLANIEKLYGGLKDPRGNFKNNFPLLFNSADKRQMLNRTAHQSDKDELYKIAKEIRDLL